MLCASIAIFMPVGIGDYFSCSVQFFPACVASVYESSRLRGATGLKPSYRIFFDLWNLKTSSCRSGNFFKEGDSEILLPSITRAGAFWMLEEGTIRGLSLGASTESPLLTSTSRQRPEGLTTSWAQAARCLSETGPLTWHSRTPP